MWSFSRCKDSRNTASQVHPILYLVLYRLIGATASPLKQVHRGGSESLTIPNRYSITHLKAGSASLFTDHAVSSHAGLTSPAELGVEEAVSSRAEGVYSLNFPGCGSRTTSYHLVQWFKNMIGLSEAEIFCCRFDFLCDGSRVVNGAENLPMRVREEIKFVCRHVQQIPESSVSSIYLWGKART